MSIPEHTYCPQCHRNDCDGLCGDANAKFERLWSKFERSHRLAFAEVLQGAEFDSVERVELFHSQMRLFLRHALTTGWNGALSGPSVMVEG